VTAAELVKHLREAARVADTRGLITIARNLRLAVSDLLEEARLEEEAAMVAHLRAHSNAGRVADVEEQRDTLLDCFAPTLREEIADERQNTKHDSKDYSE
jgi:hypothetical protein